MGLAMNTFAMDNPKVRRSSRHARLDQEVVSAHALAQENLLL